MRWSWLRRSENERFMCIGSRSESKIYNSNKELCVDPTGGMNFHLLHLV